MRALLKSVVHTAAAAFVLTIAAYDSIQTKAAIIDPDIWWHIRVGDWIVEQRSVPRVGILSQHIDRPWVAYSWGFDLLTSTVHRIYGLSGIPTLLIVLQVLISLVFLLSMRRVAKNEWWALLIAALSIYAFYVNPLRPLLFTLLFFTIELLIIFEAERRANDTLLFWMGPLFLLWANVHIQFVYGMFVLVVYVVSRRHSRKTALGVLAMAWVCSCIGPNWALPYRTAINYATHPAQYQLIQEMTAINFRRPEHYVQLLLLMGACFAVGRSHRRDVFRISLLVVTALVSFRSMRDSWFVSIAAGFLIAEAVGEAYEPAADGVVVRPIRPALQYALAAMLALGVSFQLALRDGISVPALAAVIDGVYPVGATQFVRSSDLQGPMYNDFNWGGFLIFNLSDHPVAIDPRVDLYGDDLLTRSIDTKNASPGWQTDPDLARANFVIMQRWYPLTAALANDTNFRLAYQDHLAVVFVREPRSR